MESLEKTNDGGIMKIQIMRAVLVFGLLIGMTSVMQAQTAERYRAQIPFDFSIGKKHFEAGNYFVEIRGFDRKFLFIKDAKGRNCYTATPSPSGNAGDGIAALDFRRYGDANVLEVIKVASFVSTVPKGLMSDAFAAKGGKSGGVRTVVLSAGK